MAATITKASQVPLEQTRRLLQRIWSPEIKDNPYNFVMYVFPWGQKGTPLANHSGPNEWQTEELQAMAAHIRKNKELMSIGLPPTVYKSATASGRGVGKSALVAWVTLWFMSCVPGGSAVLSANTDAQLTSKTFGEIGKWGTLSLNHYFFEKTQKKLKAHEWFAQELREQLKIDSDKYYAEGILWNEDEPDSFAGEHSGIGVLLIFDEASGISQPIWDVSEGFFTELTAYRFWFVFSNPRKNTGPFFECFHAHRNYWRTRQVDARTVKGKDKAVYQEIIDKHGDDSDTVRVEVKGQFPAQGDHQFISRDLVNDAKHRNIDRYDNNAALVVGCDPARYGNDSTVIRWRRGRDARNNVPAPTVLAKADNMKVANLLAELIDTHEPDGVFIDAGAGAGIIDRLKERGYKVHEVGFGTASGDPQYEDHRTELWGLMREWLRGGMIDQNQQLTDDLTGPEYEFRGKEDKLKLESKEKMKDRGLSSPDHADALALTFHARISRHDAATSQQSRSRRNRVAKNVNYSVFGGNNGQQ